MAEALISRAILDLEGAEDREQVIISRGIYETAKKRWKEIEADYRAAELSAVERLGEIDLGDGRRLYAGTSKRTKCKDVAVTLEALIDACGGDLVSIAECLSAGAIKHGAAREPLGDKWDEHFTVEVIKDVKTGKAKRGVKLADERYLKG